MRFLYLSLCAILAAAQKLDKLPADLIDVYSPVIDVPGGGLVSKWDPNDELAKEGGNGCQWGSVGLLTASDLSRIAVLYDAFNVETGRFVRRRQRAFCRVNVTLGVPRGWTFDVESMDFQGFFFLDSQVNASIRSNYTFHGQSAKGKVWHPFSKSQPDTIEVLGITLS